MLFPNSKRANIIHTTPLLTNDFLIFPAMHLKNGQSFDFTEHEQDESALPDLLEPVACAEYWIEQNAKWIHVINVDAAHDEDATHNWSLIESICKLPINVQYGGGIRNMEDID